MDSAMQLALMAKAKKVFGADDTFLSFPVSPLPYTKRELDFFSDRDADELRQSQHNLQAFSTLVNLIPDDEAWLPTETVFLWDVYEQILKEGNFAESTRTPEEEAAYQRALSFLRVTGEGGLFEDSPQMKAYRQHKDAFLLVEQKYNADKFTGENASDPLEKQRWKDVDEPAQRALLNELRTQWITAGYKNEVEAAQAKVVSLGARSPLQTWSEWNSRFNEDIDTVTGTDASTVFPSFFSPSNAIDDDAWQPFKLSAEEIKVLLNEAPAELRERFNADSATAGNKSLTFEFSSAAIQRPWFASDVFKARFWRFADANRVISDGGKPAKGTCPAYVTAIVFARKVREEVKPAEPVRPTIPPVGIPRPGILGRIGIMRPDLVARPGIVARPNVTPQPAPQAQTTDKPFGGFQFAAGVRDQDKLKRRMAERSIAARTPANERPAATPTMLSARMVGNPALRRPGIFRTDNPRTAIPRPAVTPADASRRLSIVRDHRLFQRLERPRIRIPQPTQPTPTPPVTPTPATPTPPVQDDSIYILAFICKAVPKAPDPDPTLQW
ncbi:MAG TPA: hypothetical protein VGO96_20925 [Pyrinomonadaceae bacterium]|jgi:hypothetical protein|nr:hypothetical protein [Pyrinomonadaceae bacterium]